MRVSWGSLFLAAGFFSLATAQAWGQSNPDAAVVTAFVQTGITDAPNNFATIRGATVATQQYRVQFSFDASSLTECYVWDLSLATGWTLSCHSTPRTDTRTHLMSSIAGDIAQALPVGFMTDGPKNRDEDQAPYQKWSGPNGIQVEVWILPEEGGQGLYYELAIVHASP